MTQPKIKSTALDIVAAVGATSQDPLTTRSYVDSTAYMNYGPKIGTSAADASVPVYSDFKFSEGEWGSLSFTLFDNQSRQVLYYHATTPTGLARPFRAYRNSDADSYVFDNDPITVPFLTGSERVRGVMNAGTNCVVLYLVNTTTQALTRWVIANTNGSSVPAEWTLAYDVTTLATPTNVNFYLVPTSSGDRILRLRWESGVVTLDVYSNALSLLRSQVLLTCATEIDQTDGSGAGRVAVGSISTVGYAGFGAPAFTWNPFTQTFHHKSNGWFTYTLGGVAAGMGYSMDVTWSMPLTWIATGTGSPSNLIPIKSGAYRYHQFNDSTWDTDNGGMSAALGNQGESPQLTTDDYSGRMFLTNRSSFSTFPAGQTWRFPAGSTYKTFGGQLGVENYYYTSIPDGVYWAKALNGDLGHIVGNNLLTGGQSQRYGTKQISTTFSTTAFDTVAVSNDTLKLDGPGAVDAAAAPSTPAIVQTYFIPGHFGTTSVAGTPVAYWCRAGQLIYTITNSGSNRTYASTGVTLPAIPSTISTLTGLTATGTYVWNGNTSTPIVWAIVRAGNGYAYVAKWAAGTWTIPANATSPLKTEIDAGNTARSDVQYLWGANSSSVLTASGKFMFMFHVPYLGGTPDYFCSYDTTNDTSVTGSAGAFIATGTGGLGQYGNPGSSNQEGRSFGFCSTFGYYALVSSNNADSMAIISSRNVETGTAGTEADWYSGASRAQKFFTTAAGIGLVAYITRYPLFLGGYYTATPDTSVSLQPSATNYIYATKDAGNRTSVTVSVSTTPVAESFSRILLATVTTNATNVVSSTSFQRDGVGLPPRISNAGKVLKTDGTALLWDDITDSVRATGSTSVSEVDRCGSVELNANSAVLTLPNTTDIRIGFETTVFVSAGVTGCTVTATGGGTLSFMGTGNGASAATRNLAAGAFATVRKVSATGWYIYGQGIS